MNAFSIILVGWLGALLHELVYLYGIKGRLQQKQFKTIFSYPSYWIIVCAMTLGSGLAGYFWFAPDVQPLRTYLLFGAAFPILFKRAMTALPGQLVKSASSPAQLAAHV
jgi:hypothetical protein